MAKVITQRQEDYARWYTDVVIQSQMADYSPVKGCMVVRPLGYALWEAMQRELDARFKETGHQNAYFPLFIPESFLKREAEHVEGFAPECALRTYCIEGLMQDGKALQAGTSHNLGQNFAKAFDVKFQTRDGDWAHVWQTSWGVSTRLIGAIVMAHGDDNGVSFPPRLAPVQVVIVPSWKGQTEKARISEAAGLAAEELKGAFRVRADLRDEVSPGWKFNEWELRGVPLRL